MRESIGAVAVDAATYAIDKLYDYLIPGELAAQAKVGCRVLVPFGKGNVRSEGILLALREEAGQPDRLKPISEVLDDEPVLDGEMIRLAAHMRERLYCTFFDCVRAMLPAGLWFKRRETYALAPGVDDARLAELQSRPGDEGRLLSLFTKETAARTLAELSEALRGRGVVSRLDSLCAEGVLVYQSNISQKTMDKTERMLMLDMEPEEAHRRLSHGRSPVRMDVVACLSDGGAMSWKELCYMTGASDAVLRAMVKSGILRMFREERLRTPDFSEVPPAPPVVLSRAQQQVYEGLSVLFHKDEAAAALLFGVTGSGKTQIYIKLIADALMADRSAIVLVPEIGLTPQVIRTFVAHFGDRVAVLHSALSAGERYDSWKKIRSGAARVVIGTRSAVFAPVRNLGVLIVDEEQDGAYKSEQSPRYHARDVAKFRAAQSRALLVLGSATPSVESYWGAMQGKYPVFRLTERYLGASLPRVVIADMRGAVRQGFGGVVGPVLGAEIEKNLADGQQTILFLNRRGNSRVIGCSMCGWVPECPSCSATLTYHSASGRAMCHYCGYSVKITGFCPDCGSGHLHTETPGTQKVEEELHALYPSARVLRMDADTTATRGAHEKLLGAFGAGRADILLGTQMVTKGLDFEKVTLVGVLDADQSLYAQDYQARERTFSLITQVVGRAGRRFNEGRAVIQTYSPEHPVILAAARQDYESFYETEIEQRGALLYPPVAQLLVLTASGEVEQQVLASLLRLKTRLEGLMEGQFRDIRCPVLGPAAAGVLRVSGRYRYHLSLRCPDNKQRRALISGVLREFQKEKQNRGVALFADQNPDSL
ncbi:MAG: primosomal protein N' [Intestinibacillus sp.]